MNYKMSDPRRKNPRMTALRYRIRQAIPESKGVMDNLHLVKSGDLREFGRRLFRRTRNDKPIPYKRVG